ncbi:MAG: selenide, water dikinase SelD [Betaproteobacteria bacterium]|nr:selenide, water dikinase SelD [Betaproteobacteria bacterium]
MTQPLDKIRLTEFSHGGGCGCKIAPAVLSELLASTPVRGLPEALMVGTETADDAAVYRLNATQALVATTDFFMPIVDDPYDFGRIAATNAISDVYAMGAQPIFALAVLGMPLEKLPVAAIRKILEGGASVCATAGIPVAGGHSIDTLEPIYGLVALGLVHPDRVKRNNSARAGDLLVLGKPLGIGILSAALKKGRLSDAGYGEMLNWTTRLNTPGVALAGMPGVHALTDVTGFGLAGHLLEICRGSRVGAELVFSALPVIEQALALAKQGVATGASERNWTGYGHDVAIAGNTPDWVRTLITDPQTSGGLLVACAAQEEDRVLAEFAGQGFGAARTIGRLVEGPARIKLT